MFAAAQAAGECFVDVTAKTLHAQVAGPEKNDQGMAVCQRLMRRMMIPGDCEIQPTFRAQRSSLWIRFTLPR